MSTAILTTSVEKIQPSAIIKLDGPLNDFHAKELIGIIEDLLPQNYVHFIINFDKCIKDKEIEDFVLNDRIEGNKNFKVNATPTIIINNKKFEKSLNYKNLKKSLEKLI